ncbi:unnamed protein product [Phyllotreta striolata]|uniref:Cytochrome P450 n=1 Tax=Phyllotreta striolata TaxID=444603 RepID=A0A9N9XL90_PHYSR|nr:unnamed protein product [Phyllotreta striolata]
MLLTNSFVIDLLLALVTLAVAGYYYVRHKYSYWTSRGVLQLKPTFPTGNYGNGLPRGITIGRVSYHLYQEFKKAGHKFGGVYMGLDPYLVIMDPDIAQQILTTDFTHFANRAIYQSPKNPITSNIITQEFKEWRNARTKLTPIFTSAKMKFFFNNMNKCKDVFGQNLQRVVNDPNKDIDIYETMACYFTDIISSAVFGVEANSFTSPDAEFRRVGRDLFDKFSRKEQLKLFLAICYPGIARLLNIGYIQDSVEEFFNNFVPEAIEHREKKGIYGTDVLQTLMELMHSDTSMTLEELISQSFIFFSAGFETSSFTSSMMLYELSMHKDMQDRVRQEINNILKENGGQLTYESLKSMKYFTQIFYETMRKYPVLATITRICVKDYEFKGHDFKIEKGTGILIPQLGFLSDPDLYPDPEVFDPERFAEKDTKHLGYMPFGEGPRNCIGSRFAILQVKLGVAEVIRNFEVSLSPNHKEPLVFNEFTFVTKVDEPILLRLKKINY